MCFRGSGCVNREPPWLSEMLQFHSLSERANRIGFESFAIWEDREDEEEEACA